MNGAVSVVHVAPPSGLRSSVDPQAARTVCAPEAAANDGEQAAETEPVWVQCAPPSIDR